MKIKNPGYADPVVAFVAANKAAIQAWVTALPAAQQSFTAADVRAAFPAVKDPLTGATPMNDGTIAEIAKALGLVVEV